MVITIQRERREVLCEGNVPGAESTSVTRGLSLLSFCVGLSGNSKLLTAYAQSVLRSKRKLSIGNNRDNKA